MDLNKVNILRYWSLLEIIWPSYYKNRTLINLKKSWHNIQNTDIFHSG